MAGVIVVCQLETCPVSKHRRPNDPTPMKLVREHFSAWVFQCQTCHNFRVVTKDRIGGTVGQGRRDDGTGTTTAKGPAKYRPGWTHA